MTIPKKAKPNRKRPLVLAVPVTAEEREMFRRMAALKRTNVAEFIRQTLFREAKFFKVA